MTAITITDLTNAKLDVDHIAEMATSLDPTCTDRLGHVKQTMSAAGNSVAVTAAGTATTARIAAEAARDAALIQAGVYTTEALGRAAVADGFAFKVQGDGNGIAAYEYRRTNSTTSVLIAMYPDSRSPYTGKPLAPDSGYVWALVDSSDHAALIIEADGTVVIPKITLPIASVTREILNSDLASVMPVSLITDSGFAWVIVDALDRLALGVTPDGKVLGNFVLPVTPGLEYLQPSKNLYFIGDSLTNGAYAQVTWREALPALISARTFTSQAVGGETSTQQAAKFGAYVSLLTLTGNQIPASGGVVITSRTINVLSAQGTQSLLGSLGGIAGTLSRNSSDVYTFTRTTAGSVVNVGVKMPFIPDVSGHDFDTLMIFVGQNNPDDVAGVQRDIAAMVATQKTAEKRFLILTPIAGGTVSTGVSTDVGTGTARLTNIKSIEDWAVQTYGDRVIKTREYSFQFNNGSADDLDDVAHEVVPRSLRMDVVHFTTAFHANIATYVASEINRRGW